MKVWGLIPARFASTRFPGKPLKKLKDKEILSWVIDLCLKSKSLDTVVVATDHADIFNLAQSKSVLTVMTSENCATGTDRLHEAIQNLKKQGHIISDEDVVINIQGDEPLLPEAYIDLLAHAFKADSHLQMATLCHPLQPDDIENKNAVKVLVNTHSEAIYFSRFSIPFSRESVSKEKLDLGLVQKHIGLYGYKVSFLNKFCQQEQAFIEKMESLEQLRALFMGIKIKVISVEKPTYGVDTPEDLEKLEKLV